MTRKRRLALAGIVIGIVLTLANRRTKRTDSADADAVLD